MKKALYLPLLLAGLADSLHAQTLPTLENAVYGGLVSTRGGGSVNWLEDGVHYSQTEKNPEGGSDIVSYSAKDLRREASPSMPG